MVEVKKPIAVRTIDINRPLKPLTNLEPYGGLRIYLTDDGRPVSIVDVVLDGHSLDVAQLRELIANQLKIFASQTICLKEDLSPDVPVSIVIATYDRPDALRRCLDALKHQESARRIEIVVVDNHPASGLTPPILDEFPEVILVNEPRQGLAYARNAGFIASTGDIVLTTDDDVIIPPNWVESIIAPFAQPEVMVVTGNTLPLELETEAQCLFEFYGGLGRGFEPKVADGHWFKQFKLGVPTWHLGATANAAFRATIFQHAEIGLMNEVLGVGMPTGCNEDTYLFYRVLKTGFTIIYEPAAYVWHQHRRDMSSLRRQLYSYSKGHVAYHLTTIIQDHDLRGLLFVCALPLARLGKLLGLMAKHLLGQKHYPLSLAWLELTAPFAGPWALWQSYRRVWREGRSGNYIPVADRLDKQQSQVIQQTIRTYEV